MTIPVSPPVAVLACFASTLLPAAIASQESALPVNTDAPILQSPPETEAGWISLFHHSERLSRTAFMSCDTNADDRLSIVEAAKTLHGVESVRNSAVFRSLDADSDGYIVWPEFDLRFREVTRRGAALLIRPTREHARAKLESAEDKTPEESRGDQLHALLDANSDGTVTLEEAQEVTRTLELPETLIYMLGTIDLDHSGVITADELAPMATMMPKPAATNAEGSLPMGYRGADANRDESLDPVELEGLLRAFDPRLSRWTEKVFADGDKSHNGALGWLELRPTAAPVTTTKPATNRTRPRTARRIRR